MNAAHCFAIIRMTLMWSTQKDTEGNQPSFFDTFSNKFSYYLRDSRDVYHHRNRTDPPRKIRICLSTKKVRVFETSKIFQNPIYNKFHLYQSLPSENRLNFSNLFIQSQFHFLYILNWLLCKITQLWRKIHFYKSINATMLIFRNLTVMWISLFSNSMIICAPTNFACSHVSHIGKMETSTGTANKLHVAFVIDERIAEKRRPRTWKVFATKNS